MASKNQVFNPGTKILNKIISKCKSSRDKKSLGYVNKVEIRTSRQLTFVKSKEKTPNIVVDENLNAILG